MEIPTEECGCISIRERQENLGCQAKSTLTIRTDPMDWMKQVNRTIELKHTWLELDQPMFHGYECKLLKEDKTWWLYIQKRFYRNFDFFIRVSTNEVQSITT